MKKIKRLLKRNALVYNFFKRIYSPIRNYKQNIVRKKEYAKTINIINRVKELKCKKIFYVGIPIHKNLGDLAQWYCITEWVKNYYSNYEIIEVADFIINNNYKNIMGTLKDICQKDDIFIFQSGYRTTDVENIYGEYAHRKILENFKNKVYVFPQTVNFKDENEAHKSAEAYLKNDNYLFMARDEFSYESANKLYNPNRVRLYPDIVTNLIGKYSFENEREGVLFCLRDDNEKLYSDKQINELINELREESINVDRTDTNSKMQIEYLRENIKEILEEKFEDFSKYKVVVTDRYHGTIFSLISNTPVIVINSCDHKLSSGVNWFKGIYDNYVYYANSLEDVKGIIDTILNNKYEYKLSDYFEKKYYVELKNEFDK